MQESIYDKFMEMFLAKTAALKVGDPFNPETFQGPQISKTQYNVSRIISCAPTRLNLVADAPFYLFPLSESWPTSRPERTRERPSSPEETSTERRSV